MKYYKTMENNPYMPEMLAMNSDDILQISANDFEKYWFLNLETNEEDREKIGSDYHEGGRKKVDPEMKDVLLVFGDIVENQDGKFLLGFDYNYPEIIIVDRINPHSLESWQDKL